MKTYVAFTMWLVLCFIGFAWALTLRLVIFDLAITQKFTEHYGDLSNQAFHISQSGCFCQQVAQPHINSVTKVLTEHGFSNRSLLLKRDRFLLKYLSATHAIVVFEPVNSI